VLVVLSRGAGAGGDETATVKIAGGIISLMLEGVLMANVHLIAAFARCFIDKHFNWLQQRDYRNGGDAGTPGCLSRLMLGRYFLMDQDLEAIENDGWQTKREFLKKQRHLHQ